MAALIAVVALCRVTVSAATLRAGIGLGLAGAAATLALAASPASALPQITVTPYQGLADIAIVQVAGTGFGPSYPVEIFEVHYGQGGTVDYARSGTLASPTTDGSGNIPATITAVTRTFNSSRPVDCNVGGLCQLSAQQANPGSFYFGTTHPIYFASGPPPPSGGIPALPALGPAPHARAAALKKCKKKPKGPKRKKCIKRANKLPG